MLTRPSACPHAVHSLLWCDYPGNQRIFPCYLILDFSFHPSDLEEFGPWILATRKIGCGRVVIYSDILSGTWMRWPVRWQYWGTAFWPRGQQDPQRPARSVSAFGRIRISRGWLEWVSIGRPVSVNLTDAAGKRYGRQSKLSAKMDKVISLSVPRPLLSSISFHPLNLVCLCDLWEKHREGACCTISSPVLTLALQPVSPREQDGAVPLQGEKREENRAASVTPATSQVTWPLPPVQSEFSLDQMNSLPRPSPT